MNTTNELRDAVARGQGVLGSILRSPDIRVAEITGLTGFDFGWIDMEHSVLSLREAETLIVALRGHGCLPLVRVPRNDAHIIGLALDMGAAIVDVPHVDTVEDAKHAVEAAKYYPIGRRGYMSSGRHTRHGSEKLNIETMQRLNAESLLMVQIESVKGLKNVDAIAAVEGVDALFFGQGDMSQDLGVPGDVHHPKCVEAARTFFNAVRRQNKIAAALGYTPEILKQNADQGCQMFLCAGDELSWLRSGLRTLLDTCRRTLKP